MAKHVLIYGKKRLIASSKVIGVSNRIDNLLLLSHRWDEQPSVESVLSGKAHIAVVFEFVSLFYRAGFTHFLLYDGELYWHKPRNVCVVITHVALSDANKSTLMESAMAAVEAFLGK